MKKLLLAIALVGMAFSVKAQSPYELVTLVSPNTLSIQDGATSNYTSVVNVRRSDIIGIQTSIQLEGAGTDGCIFKFKKSVDGSNFETTPSILITNAAAGTTHTHYFNQVTVSGVQAIQLSSIVNGVSGQAITNFSVRVGIPAR